MISVLRRASYPRLVKRLASVCQLVSTCAVASAGGVCTHLGCVPLPNAGDYHGWFCPAMAATTTPLGGLARALPPTTWRSRSTASLMRIHSRSAELCALIRIPLRQVVLLLLMAAVKDLLK